MEEANRTGAGGGADAGACVSALASFSGRASALGLGNQNGEVLLPRRDVQAQRLLPGLPRRRDVRRDVRAQLLLLPVRAPQSGRE